MIVTTAIIIIIIISSTTIPTIVPTIIEAPEPVVVVTVLLIVDGGVDIVASEECNEVVCVVVDDTIVSVGKDPLVLDIVNVLNNGILTVCYTIVYDVPVTSTVKYVTDIQLLHVGYKIINYFTNLIVTKCQ